jgi:hypothetical protein
MEVCSDCGRNKAKEEAVSLFLLLTVEKYGWLLMKVWNRINPDFKKLNQWV